MDIRAWKHDRKGLIVGTVVRETNEWITIICTEENRQCFEGEELTFRKSLAREVTL